MPAHLSHCSKPQIYTENIGGYENFSEFPQEIGK